MGRLTVILGLRGKLFLYFMLIIVLTIVLMEGIIIYFVKNNYYKNLEDTLTGQIVSASDFYNRYFSSSTLQENLINNIETFWRQTDAQVQIYDDQQVLVMDSIGVSSDRKDVPVEVVNALHGQKGIWTGNVLYSTYPVIAITYPLKANNKIIGSLRFISSLEQVDNEVAQIARILLFLGGFVILISGFIAFILAYSMIKPIRNLTAIASTMATGNFTVRYLTKHKNEIGKLADTLNFMAEEVQKNERLKNDFISSISHELKTPLTSIVGWADTLKNEKFTEDKKVQKEGLHIVSDEALRLTKLVDDLLDFSKLLSSRIKLNKKPTNLEYFVTYLLKHFAARANQESKTLTHHFSSYIPNLNLDWDRMKQAMINVVDNAFKYTDSGATILIKVEQIESQYVQIIVQDNGHGIKPEDLPNVKMKFYKGSDSKNSSGIGLSISDEIIGLHGGTFQIESVWNEGTQVIIRLPLDDKALTR